MIKYTKNHIEILDVLNLHWNIECHCDIREYTKNHTEILHFLILQWNIECQKRQRGRDTRKPKEIKYTKNPVQGGGGKFWVFLFQELLQKKKCSFSVRYVLNGFSSTLPPYNLFGTHNGSNEHFFETPKFIFDKKSAHFCPHAYLTKLFKPSHPISTHRTQNEHLFFCSNSLLYTI